MLLASDGSCFIVDGPLFFCRLSFKWIYVWLISDRTKVDFSVLSIYLLSTTDRSHSIQYVEINYRDLNKETKKKILFFSFHLFIHSCPLYVSSNTKWYFRMDAFSFWKGVHSFWYFFFLIFFLFCLTSLVKRKALSDVNSF